VLILLDCCAAASSINTSGHGVNETIAACGFEGIAPPPGPHSFTNTLIEILEEWKGRVQFSISLLHSEVLFQLKRKRPEKGRDGTRIAGWCSTPVHYISTSDPRPQSIELGRIRSPKDTAVVSSPHLPPPREARLPKSTLQDEQITSLSSITPLGRLTVPHVLISVALEEDQADLSLESCRFWLTRFPAFIKYAKVQGVFKSYSTLILLSLPIAIWNMLPENKACLFISFITTGNLACTTPMVYDEASLPARSLSQPPSMKSIAPTPPSALDWHFPNTEPWAIHKPNQQTHPSMHDYRSSSTVGYEYAGWPQYATYSPKYDSGQTNTSQFGHAEAYPGFLPVPDGLGKNIENKYSESIAKPSGTGTRGSCSPGGSCMRRGWPILPRSAQRVMGNEEASLTEIINSALIQARIASRQLLISDKPYEDIDSPAGTRRAAEEILKAIHALGYTVPKETSPCHLLPRGKNGSTSGRGQRYSKY
jgi:hypothetical protein